MVDSFMLTATFIVGVGFTWWVSTVILRHGDKADDDLSARIDKLETKEIEGE